jgi:hypothetical protein
MQTYYLKVHPDDLRERRKLRDRYDANAFPIS